MRYRDYKSSYEGQIAHVFNRGNNKQKIHLDKYDFHAIIKRFRLALGMEYSESKLNIKPFIEKTFDVLAYCFMDNHFHMIIRQNTFIPISKLIGKVYTSYSKYFNTRHNRVGSLFQDQFKLKPITDDSYLLNLVHYIHNNPVNPYDWEYSSLKGFVDINHGSLVTTSFARDLFLDYQVSFDDYRDWAALKSKEEIESTFCF